MIVLGVLVCARMDKDSALGGIDGIGLITEALRYRVQKLSICSRPTLPRLSPRPTMSCSCLTLSRVASNTAITVSPQDADPAMKGKVV